MVARRKLRRRLLAEEQNQAAEEAEVVEPTVVHVSTGVHPAWRVAGIIALLGLAAVSAVCISQT